MLYRELLIYQRHTIFHVRSEPKILIFSVGIFFDTRCVLLMYSNFLDEGTEGEGAAKTEIVAGLGALCWEATSVMILVRALHF